MVVCRLTVASTALGAVAPQAKAVAAFCGIFDQLADGRQVSHAPDTLGKNLFKVSHNALISSRDIFRISCP